MCSRPVIRLEKGHNVFESLLKNKSGRCTAPGVSRLRRLASISLRDRQEAETVSRSAVKHMPRSIVGVVLGWQVSHPNFWAICAKDQAGSGANTERRYQENSTCWVSETDD